jgi:hypothetical protein
MIWNDMDGAKGWKKRICGIVCVCACLILLLASGSEDLNLRYCRESTHIFLLYIAGLLA